MTEQKRTEVSNELTEEQSGKLDNLICYILGLETERECDFYLGVQEGHRVLHLPPVLSPEEQDQARRDLKGPMVRAMEHQGTLHLWYGTKTAGKEILNGFRFYPDHIHRIAPAKLLYWKKMMIQSGALQDHIGASCQIARLDLS